MVILRERIMTQKKLSIKGFIVIITVWLLVPLGYLAIIADEFKLMGESMVWYYFKIYLAISAIPIIPSIILYFFGFSWLIPFSFSIFSAFFFIATFPFTLSSFLITIFVVILGLLMPFLSQKTTWWFYTLGGRLPLPAEHQWLKKKGFAKRTKISYRKFMDEYYMGAVALGATILAAVIFNTSHSVAFLILKVFFLFLVFGMALTLGAYIRKKTK